jgi:hypothetical protein
MFGLKSKSDRGAKRQGDPSANASDEEPDTSSDIEGERPDNHRATPTARDQYDYRHAEFGGFKGGAVFYGWLVAVALTILLVGVVSAVATAVGSSLDVTKAQAELQADNIGISSAIAILVILMIGYFAGGYVAGRLSRFDGARQGFGVWMVGLIITIAVVIVGVVFGNQYNIFQRINLPSIPIPEEALSQGGVLTLAAVLLGTLIASFLGGIAGQRFHTRIDRTTL